MLCRTILLVKHLLKKIGDKIFAWAWGRFINKLMNWEWIGIRADGQIRFQNGYVWTWKPLNSAKKNLRMQKYPETFGRGLSHRVDTSLYLSSSWISVSKAMICYSHSLFLVCSHVKGDFVVDKKYCLKLEASSIWKLCKPSTSTRAWISVLNRPFALWCHFTTPTTILQGFSFFWQIEALVIYSQWGYQI